MQATTKQRIRRSALRAMIFAAAAALQGASCAGSMSNPIVNIDSNCKVGANAPWANLGFQYHLKAPVCDVPLKTPGSPSEPNILFRLDTWDVATRTIAGDLVYVSILDAGGLAQNFSYFAFFDLPIGQPNGVRAAKADMQYKPGMRGLILPYEADTARVKFYPISGTSSAEAIAVLKYKAEANVALSGPTSATWGDPVTFNANADNVRRPATARWKLDGVLVQTTTIGWPSKYQAFMPGFGSSGNHTISVETTSGTGKVTTASKSINIRAPVECLRSAPATPEPNSPDGTTTLPLSPPPHNSCPP